MKILFFGDRPLGENCLRVLLRLHCFSEINLVGVVARDLKENWWGPSNFRIICSGSIKFIDPDIFNISEVIKELNPDLIVSVLYPKKIPQGSIRSINLHCAPLPSYKGYNSTFWAIVNKEERFGPTIHLMTDSFDSGDLIVEDLFEVEKGCTNIELYNSTHKRAYNLFYSTIEGLIKEYYNPYPQKGEGRFYERELPSRNLTFETDLEKVILMSRAFYFPPFEPAFYLVNGRKYHIIPEKEKIK